MSVITTLGPVVNGGEKVFLNGTTMDDMVKRAHAINNSHVRYVLGAFDKILHGGSIWIGHRYALYFILHK